MTDWPTQEAGVVLIAVALFALVVAVLRLFDWLAATLEKEPADAFLTPEGRKWQEGQTLSRRPYPPQQMDDEDVDPFSHGC